MSYHFGIQDEISIMNKLRLNKVIEKIKSNGFKLKLLVTINSENYMNILDMCQKAINLGAYGIEFTLLLKQGDAINMNLQNTLNKEQQNHFFQQLKLARQTFAKDKLIIDRSGIFGKDSSNDNCHFNCPAGKDLVVITPDNNVYPCMFLAKEGYKIGKIIDNKIVLDYNIQNDGQRCVAYEICNNDNKEIFKQMKGV